MLSAPQGWILGAIAALLALLAWRGGRVSRCGIDGWLLATAVALSLLLAYFPPADSESADQLRETAEQLRTAGITLIVRELGKGVSSAPLPPPPSSPPGAGKQDRLAQIAEMRAVRQSETPLEGPPTTLS